MVHNQGQYSLPGDSWQHLKTFQIITPREFLKNKVGINAAKHSIIHSMPPSKQKNYQSQSVNSAETEKSCKAKLKE